MSQRKQENDDLVIARLERLTGGYLSQTTPRVRRGLGLTQPGAAAEAQRASGSDSEAMRNTRSMDPLEETMTWRLRKSLGP